MQFVEISESGEASPAGYAPYLDYRPPTPEELEQIQSSLNAPWLRDSIEKKAQSFAIQNLIPDHLREVRARRAAHITKTMEQVHERLTEEIVYWNGVAAELELAEQAGKTNARLNAKMARDRATNLTDRLRARMLKLEAEKKIVALPPAISGGALVVSENWLAECRATSRVAEEPPAYARNTKPSELLAMKTVMAFESSQGFQPRDVSRENRGYDIESRDPNIGNLRFIEVKGRAAGAETVTLTRNEVLTASE